MQNILLNYYHNDIFLIISAILFTLVSFTKPRLGVVIASIIYIYSSKSILSLLFILFIVLSKNNKEYININLKHLFFIILVFVPFLFFNNLKKTTLNFNINVNFLLIITFIISIGTYYLFKRKESK